VPGAIPLSCMDGRAMEETSCPQPLRPDPATSGLSMKPPGPRCDSEVSLDELDRVRKLDTGVIGEPVVLLLMARMLAERLRGTRSPVVPQPSQSTL
jgi:hypothetical protein